MSRRTTVLAAGGFAASVALTLAGFALVVGGGAPVSAASDAPDVVDGVVSILLLTSAAVGAFVAARRPRNPIGWILITSGLAASVEDFAAASTYVAFEVRAGSLPLAEYVAVVGDAMWVPSFVLGLTFVFLLFPDGSLPSRRWRPVAWIAGVAIALSLPTTLLAPGPLYYAPERANPLGLTQAGDVLGGLQDAAFLAMLGTLVAAFVALVLRFRRSRGDERQQMKWFAYGAGLLVAALPVSIALDDTVLGASLFEVTVVLPTVAIGIAILKYRLYDIDVVISRTLVFVALATLITGVYAAIVVGVGSLVGTGDEPNLALAIVATALVAVVFEPARARLQRWANRLVFGERATPYEVLAGLTSGSADEDASEESLVRLARLLAEGTGGRRSVVWLNIAGRLRPAAVWPTNGDRFESVQVTTDSKLPELPGDIVVPVVHDESLLGVLSVHKARGENVTSNEQRLLEDVAGSAALLLRNVRLNAQLAQRAQEIDASRARVVAAQDTERRRLERDLHDGAQQQIVALKIKLGLAKTLALREDAAPVAEAIEQVTNRTDRTVEQLRVLARGIYPPLLEAEGLEPAITAQARLVDTPTTVSAVGLERYDQDLESTVYFCVVEAVRNAAEHARASHISVHLDGRGEALRFTVSDDGDGFDPEAATEGTGLVNVTDRLDVFDGELEVRSSPGQGTTILGSLPIGARVSAETAATSS